MRDDRPGRFPGRLVAFGAHPVGTLILQGYR